MKSDSCHTYLELLALSKTTWSQDDNQQVNQVRQRLLDHLVKRYHLSEASIAHLR